MIRNHTPLDQAIKTLILNQAQLTVQAKKTRRQVLRGDAVFHRICPMMQEYAGVLSKLPDAVREFSESHPRRA